MVTEYRFGSIEKIYVPNDEGVSTLYLTRLHLGKLYLHFFSRGDMDRCPHDHPWDFWTFPLTTYYEEVWAVGNISRFEGKRLNLINANKKVQRFRFHFRPATYIHRILHPAPGKRIITLFWSRRAKRQWGFWKNGLWIYHHLYLKEDVDLAKERVI